MITSSRPPGAAGRLLPQSLSNVFFSFTGAELLACSGGADRDRTDDIQLAKLALYQLSYGPWYLCTGYAGSVVGLERFELSTPRLSSVCSNQLSYRPGIRVAPGEDVLVIQRPVRSLKTKQRGPNARADLEWPADRGRRGMIP